MFFFLKRHTHVVCDTTKNKLMIQHIFIFGKWQDTSHMCTRTMWGSQDLQEPKLDFRNASSPFC
jgi:hypothetical protein